MRRSSTPIFAIVWADRTHGNDRHYIEDIDLAGVASPWAEFMQRGNLLRAEFSAQTDAQYLAGQVRFLDGLRQRPRLFLTDYFRARHEDKARHNLECLLGLLAKQG